MTGVVVVDVRDGSIAQTAGVKVGDVVTAINGERVSGGLELRALLANLTVGTPISLQLHYGSTSRQHFRLATRPEV